MPKQGIGDAINKSIEVLSDARVKYSNLANERKDERIKRLTAEVARAVEDLNGALSSPDYCCDEWPNVCGDVCPVT